MFPYSTRSIYKFFFEIIFYNLSLIISYSAQATHHTYNFIINVFNFSIVYAYGQERRAADKVLFLTDAAAVDVRRRRRKKMNTSSGGC